MTGTRYQEYNYYQEYSIIYFNYVLLLLLRIFWKSNLQVLCTFKFW